jgi:glycogen debranching enzyme
MQLPGQSITTSPISAPIDLDALEAALCAVGNALRMSLDLLPDFPLVARVTLLELARLQGVRYDPRAEEEPGRMLHEHRLLGDPILRELERFWTFPYYGSVDSTPQWINLLGRYIQQEDDAILDERFLDRHQREHALADSLEAALGWIIGRLDDPSGGGYLWVRRAHAEGIPNQVWEDSGDSYYHADGTIFDFTQPYAPVAVQGYTYDALLAAADLSERGTRSGGEPHPSLAGRALLEPQGLRARAAALRTAFLRDFWQPDLGTFALALTFDRDDLGPRVDAESATAPPPAHGRPARVIASSPGHLLASRLLDGDDVAEQRTKLIARLFAADMLAGAGIRTRSTGAARFRAGSYHNGSTWPVDTGIIADGLRRHGETALADELESRILAGCSQVGAFPEFFRGNTDGSIALNEATLDQLVDGVMNRLEQPPQMAQGWTITRVWSILRRRNLLGVLAERAGG